MFEIKDGVLTNYTGKDGDIIIPNGVTSIDDRLFSRCKRLTSVTIPGSVKNIGEDAFYNCSELTNATIGDGVTSLGQGAFQDCTGLTSITIPDSVKFINGYTFAGCIRLKSVTIGSSIRSIGGYAFSSCTSLASITIPNSVTTIGAYAFCDCRRLKSITIPNSVTTINYGAFDNCTKLKTQKSIYKAFDLRNDKLSCRRYEFKENKWSDKIKDVSLCNKGYHYCENLFDIFNYYCGKIDKNIAIYECEAKGISNEVLFDSKRVCQQIKPTKRLYREDVIKILNGGKP